MKITRLIAGFLALCFTVGLLCLPVSAVSTVTSGNITWTFDEASGTLTISGSGAAKGIPGDASEGWRVNKSDIRHVVFTEGITEITGGFERLTKMQTLQIANSVKSIGWGAFSECDSLQTLDLGQGIRSVGDMAFSGAYALEAVTLPASLQNIGVEAFSCCGLKTVALPEGISIIQDGAFRANQQLTKLYLPDSVTRINYAAFRDCNALTDIYYSGTQAQWDAIDIDSKVDGQGPSNGPLFTATVHLEHRHSFDGGTVTTQANCVQKGVKTYSCTVCGGTKQETFSGSHTWDSGVVTKPTCTKDGATVYTCTTCKQTKSGSITATGHNWGDGIKNADTTISYTCKNCSEIKIEGTPVAPPETTAPTVAVDATEAPTVGDTISPTITRTPEDTTSPTEDISTDTQEPKPVNSFPWGIVIGAAVVVLAGSAGAWFWLKKKK